jgi:hypothetical protein
MPPAPAGGYLRCMDYALVEIRCPPMSPALYLEWASWWHRVEQRLASLAGRIEDPDLQVQSRPGLWDRLLDEISKDASRAMLSRGQTIEPTARAAKHEVVEGSRIAHARLTWIRGTDEGATLRPSPAVSRLMSKLGALIDQSIGERSSLTVR